MADVKELISAYEKIERQLNKLLSKKDVIKDSLKVAIGDEKKVVVNLDNGHAWSVVVVDGYNRETVNKDKVREILGDAQYKKCVSISKVAESLRVSVDKNTLL